MPLASVVKSSPSAAQTRRYLRPGARDKVRPCLPGKHTWLSRKGANIVIDKLGSDMFDASLRAMPWRSRIVMVSFAAGRISEVKVIYLLIIKDYYIGLQWTDYCDRQSLRMPWRTPR
jgi:NADPH:quinone reductase-like Zn-dependent oxidoreductase